MTASAVKVVVVTAALVAVEVVVAVDAAVEIIFGGSGFWETATTLIKLGSTSVHDNALLDVRTRTMEDLPFNFSILSGSGVAGKQDSSPMQVA